MKSTKDFRIKQQSFDSEDSMKRAAKLEPIKKSGKEKRAIYSQLDDEDDDAELLALRKKESVLDYFDDDESAEEEFDDEELDDGYEDDVEEEEWEEDLEEEEDEPEDRWQVPVTLYANGCPQAAILM